MPTLQLSNTLGKTMNSPLLDGFHYCAAPPRILPKLSTDMPAPRVRAILRTRAKWVNGTTLRYYFSQGPDKQRQVVREAFAEWKSLGIGLSFHEVDDPAEAEVRIGFDQSDGSWSYLGTDVLTIGTDQRTMNFGWDLTTRQGKSTALHEIGHTLGKPHEHQNPKSGIVWDEAAVYRTLGGPPNRWDRATTHHNILRKLDPGEIEGSNWDPDSIMHYPFPAGLIREPTQYATEGLNPPGTLSALDQEYMRAWYPALEDELPTLHPFASAALSLNPGQQADFSIEPAATREYNVGTFGAADTLLVLFEEVDGELRYRAGDDDSGEERNALLKVKLYKGRRYVARVRLYWAWASGDTAVMLW
jgi:hypothetical protein